jgi:hypothetical protein
MNLASQRGLGISSTTTSLIPELDTRTKTPEARNRSEVGRHANAALGGDSKKLAQPPKPQHLGSAGTHAKLVSDSKKKFTSSLDAKTYRRLIDSGHYFDNLSDAHDSLLETALGRVRLALPVDPNRPEEMQGTDLAVLVQVLGEVAKTVPNKVQDVVRGLACLRNIDLLDSIRNPANTTTAVINQNPRVACPSDDGGFEQADLDCAWRLAQTLAKTPDGFDLLRKLTVSTQPADLHKTVTWHDDGMLHVFLDATREMAKEAKLANQTDQPVVHDPDAVYDQIRKKMIAGHATEEQLANPGQNMTRTVGNLTLLEKGVLALQDRLKRSEAHAAANPAQPFDIPRVNQNGNDWAVGMIRNGIYTDALRDADGKPTLFALVQGRIGKLTSAIEATYTEPDSMIGKIAKEVKQFAMPRTDKSPFNAYNRLGKGDDAVGFKQSEKMGGIFEGRAVREHLIDNVIKGLKTQGGGTMAAPAPLLPINAKPDGVNNMPTDRALRNLVRLAILEQSNTTLFIPRYQDGDKLNSFELDKAKARVFDYLGGNAAKNTNLVAELDDVLKAQNVGYLPNTLMQWAGDVGGPANAKEAIALAGASYAANAPDNPDWHKFGKAIDFVVNSTVTTEPTPNLVKNNQGMTGAEQVTAVAGRFREAIAGQELGSRFSFSSGGVVGAKTGGVTVALTNLMTLGTVRGKVNVVHERARTAVFEAGTGTSGNELVIGTESANKTSVGVGAGKGILKPIGVSGDVAFGYDGADRRGALLRFDRTETGGVYGDASNNAQLGKVAEMILDRNATGPSGEAQRYLLPADPADQTSLLKKLLQEHPRLSVSWLGTDETRVSGQGGVSASVGVGHGKLTASLAAVASGANVSRSTQEWSEQGGWLRVDKTTTTKSFKINLGVSGPSVGSVLSKVDIHGTGGTVSSSGISLAANSADVYRKTYTERDTLIEKDGKLLKQTFRTKNFLSAEDFYQYAAQRLDTMAVDKANKYEKSKVHADPEREVTYENEYNKLKEFIDFHRANAEINRFYQVYLEPKDDVVDVVNALKSLKINAEAAGDKKTAKDCDERIRKMLKDDKSWETCFVTALSNTSDTRLRGWGAVVKDQKLDNANFTQIIGFT